MMLTNDGNPSLFQFQIHENPLIGHSHQYIPSRYTIYRFELPTVDWGQLRMTQLRIVLQHELLRLSLHSLLILYL